MPQLPLRQPQSWQLRRYVNHKEHRWLDPQLHANRQRAWNLKLIVNWSNTKIWADSKLRWIDKEREEEVYPSQECRDENEGAHPIRRPLHFSVPAPHREPHYELNEFWFGSGRHHEWVGQLLYVQKFGEDHQAEPTSDSYSVRAIWLFKNDWPYSLGIHKAVFYSR